MTAYEILKERGVSRLCHFTKFKSFTEIITSEEGILATSQIGKDVIAVTDPDRYDGERGHVCCSVEYPNCWYFSKAAEGNPDKLFRDWVVLYLDLRILNVRRGKFCPCNASKNGGIFLVGDLGKIGQIYETVVSGRQRPPEMLRCCPTDDQAEILIERNVPREYICGIAVKDTEMAARVRAILKMYDLLRIPIYVSPEALSKEWSRLARRGIRAEETLYEE